MISPFCVESTDKSRYNPKYETLRLAAHRTLYLPWSIRHPWGYPIGRGELTGEAGALRVSSFLCMMIADTNYCYM